MIVMTAVSPPAWNCPRALSEVPLMRMVSSASKILSFTIVNTVLLIVPGTSPARNVTTLGLGPPKSAEAKKWSKAICLGPKFWKVIACNPQLHDKACTQEIDYWLRACSPHPPPPPHYSLDSCPLCNQMKAALPLLTSTFLHNTRFLEHTLNP